MGRIKRPEPEVGHVVNTIGSIIAVIEIVAGIVLLIWGLMWVISKRFC